MIVFGVVKCFLLRVSRARARCRPHGSVKPCTTSSVTGLLSKTLLSQAMDSYHHRDAEIVDPKDAEIALLKRQLATLKREMKRQSLERLLAAERKFFERMQDKLAQDSLGMCTDPKSKDALAPNKRSKIAQASNPQPNKLAVSLCLLSTLSNTVLSHSCVRTCTSSFVTPCAPPAHPPFPPNIGLRLVARSTGTRASSGGPLH